MVFESRGEIYIYICTCIYIYISKYMYCSACGATFLVILLLFLIIFQHVLKYFRKCWISAWNAITPVTFVIYQCQIQYVFKVARFVGCVHESNSFKHIIWWILFWFRQGISLHSQDNINALRLFLHEIVSAMLFVLRKVFSCVFVGGQVF